MSRGFLRAVIWIVVLAAALGVLYLRFGLDREDLLDESTTTDLQLRGQYVYDDASLLTDDAIEQMTKILKFVHRHLDMELVVVIVSQLPEGQDIVTWATKKVEELQIGAMTSTNRKGVLFGVAIEAQLVRVEVGYEIEDVYPDSIVSYYENEMMKPYFAHNEVAIGVIATVEHMINRAFEQSRTTTEDGRGKQGDSPLSGGAGATTKAPVNLPKSYVVRRVPEERRLYYSPQPTPWESMNLLKEKWCNRIADHSLPIYTKESRERFKDKLSTPAQFDMSCKMMSIPEVYTEEHCRVQGDFAVIRYPFSNRKSGPRFFRRNEEGLWEFDMVTGSDFVIYDFVNEWNFLYGYPSNYMFAFQDWCFDQYGTPWEKILRLGIWYVHANKPNLKIPRETKKAIRKFGSPVFLSYIENWSTAKEAGLMPGDLLLEIAGRPIQTVKDASDAIKNTGEEPFLIKAARGEKVFEVSVLRHWRCPAKNKRRRSVPAAQAASIHHLGQEQIK